MIDQEKLNSQEETNFQTGQDEEYGLPVAEYSPLEYDQSQEIESEHEPVQSKHDINVKPEKEGSKVWPILLTVILLLAAGGGALYYFVFSPQEEVVITPPVTEVITPEPEPEPFIEETPAPVEEWAPPVQKEGSVTAISGKTGRYYVIIGSFIDADMARDYADKLAAQGNQVSVLEPSGNAKFYRLGVNDAASFSEASAALDNLKNTFGQDIWVIRY